MITLYDLFLLSLQDFPEDRAIVCKDKILNYKQLNDSINSVTASMLSWGIEKGSRVGIFYPNCTLYPALLYSSIRLGTVFAPININLSHQELIALINKTGCTYILYDERFEEKISEIKSNCPNVKQWISGNDNSIASPMDSQQAFSLAQGECRPVSHDDDALIIFTGGTTGHGTGVLSTQEALVNRVVMKWRDVQRTMHSDTMLNHSPLFHTGGLSLMIQALSAGACFVMSEKFNPEGIIDDCGKFGVTQVALIPPTIIYRIAEAKNLDRDKLKTVRLCIMAGGPTEPETAEKVFDTFRNTELYLNYGSSENSITLGHVMNREDCRKYPWRLKSSGINNMASFVRLKDENGNDVPDGEAGEAWGKSPCQMKEYIGEPFTTKDGWVPTGDIFRKDQDGYFYFVCRKKNMIKSAGENVYSEEVESVLKEHPAVHDCIVFGFPSPEHGELVAAAIVMKSGMSVSGEELVEHCRARIASYKKPRRIYFIESIPTTAAGKNSRHSLKEMLLKREADFSLENAARGNF